MLEMIQDDTEYQMKEGSIVPNNELNIPKETENL